MYRHAIGVARALTLMGLFLAGLFAVPVSAADKPAPAILVFDSSGSMAAILPDGKSKLDTARSIVSETLKSWPAGGDLGLIAYGHRRKSDCTDIETILPLGPLDPATVTQALRPLMARGKTPLSRSLQAAAKLLPSGEAATIVLVSDGIETCDADPCATAAALKAANISLVIDVVGFGVQKDEIEQLSCIADAADGQFFDAKNAEALTTALQTVKEAVVTPPPSPPEPPAPPPPPSSSEEPTPPPTETSPPSSSPDPTVTVRTELSAVAGQLGALVDVPVHWTVTGADGKPAYDGDSRKLELSLLPGSYTVKADAANATGSTTIEVLPGQDQAFDIRVQAGRVDLSLAANDQAPVYTDTEVAGIAWTVIPLDGQPAVAAPPPVAAPPMLLAPGHYRIAADFDQLHGETNVDVAVGEAHPAKLTFALGTVTLEAALDETAEPLSDASLLTWKIALPGKEAKTITGQARPEVTLPEGTYSVVLSVAGAEVTSQLEVKAGDQKTQRVIAPTGTLNLSARLGPNSPPLDDWRDTFWTVSSASASGTSEPVELQESSPSLPLPPGQWHVVLLSGSVTTEQEVTVLPGAPTPLAITLNAGRVTITATAPDGSTASDVEYSATKVGADGAPATSADYDVGSSDTVTTILAAGHWRIAALSRDGQQADADIDLKAGDNITVPLALK